MKIQKQTCLFTADSDAEPQGQTLLQTVVKCPGYAGNENSAASSQLMLERSVELDALQRADLLDVPSLKDLHIPTPEMAED